MSEILKCELSELLLSRMEYRPYMGNSCKTCKFHEEDGCWNLCKLNRAKAIKLKNDKGICNYYDEEYVGGM